MSEKLLKFLLGELQTIRLVCQGSFGGKTCGTTLELPLHRLLTIYNRIPVCSVCGMAFGVAKGMGTFSDGFGPLAQAIIDMQTASERVLVEFVLPDTAPTAEKKTDPEKNPKK